MTGAEVKAAAVRYLAGQPAVPSLLMPKQAAPAASPAGADAPDAPASASPSKT